MHRSTGSLLVSIHLLMEKMKLEKLGTCSKQQLVNSRAATSFILQSLLNTYSMPVPQLRKVTL